MFSGFIIFHNMSKGNQSTPPLLQIERGATERGPVFDFSKEQSNSRPNVAIMAGEEYEKKAVDAWIERSARKDKLYLGSYPDPDSVIHGPWTPKEIHCPKGLVKELTKASENTLVHQGGIEMKWSPYDEQPVDLPN